MCTCYALISISRMTSWTVKVLLLLCNISYSTSQYLVAENEKGPMTEAFQRCRDRGGTLVTVDQLHQHAEVIKKQCSNRLSSATYWIGNYSILTPFITLEGCFENKFEDTMLFTIEDNSVARCTERCRQSNYNGIAIMGILCQCVSDTDRLKRTNASSCNIFKNEEVLGGNLSAMPVYKKSNVRASVDGINPYCIHGKCDNLGYTFLKCTSGEVSTIVCDNGGLDNDANRLNTSSWREAMEECIFNQNRYLLTPEQYHTNQVSLCEKNGHTLTWTSQRQYKDQIIISDTGLLENAIFSHNLVCQSANLEGSNYTTQETHICNSYAGERHGYLCYIDSDDSPTSYTTTCVVNLSPTTTQQSSTKNDVISSTTSETTVVTKYTTEEHDEITTVTTNTTGDVTSVISNEKSNFTSSTTVEMEENTLRAETLVDTASMDFPSGAIIGAAVGGCVALAVTVVVMIIIKRRMGNTKDSKGSPSSDNFRLDKTESAIYAESKDETYDILNKRKQRLSQVEKHTDDVYAHAKTGTTNNVENAYDSTPNLITSERNSAYETCCIGSGLDGDPLYDQTVRTAHEEDATINDQVEDHYDTSNIYDGKYDRCDRGTNIYDQCGSFQRSEEGNGTYDETRECDDINSSGKSGTSIPSNVGTDVYDETSTAIYATVKKFKPESQEKDKQTNDNTL